MSQKQRMFNAQLISNLIEGKMMSFAEDIIFVTFYVMLCLVCQFALLVIRKYHENKPLGFQTILSKVIVIFLKVFAVVDIAKIAIVCLAELLGPLPRWVSVILTVSEFVFHVALFYSLITLLVTKYVSIHFNNMIAGLDEERLLNKIKTSIVVVPMISSFSEYTYFSRFDDLAKFQQKFLGYAKEDSTSEVITAVFILAIFLAWAIIYTRIEYDAIQAEDDHTGNLGKFIKWLIAFRHDGFKIIVYKHFGYTMRVMRTVWICGLSMVLLIVYNFTVGQNNTKWNTLLFTIVMTVFVPIIFILKHDGIKSVAVKMLKNFIPDRIIIVNV